jgi:hypothetical protein
MIAHIIFSLFQPRYAAEIPDTPIAVGHAGLTPSPKPISQTITALLQQLRGAPDEETPRKKQ